MAEKEDALNAKAKEVGWRLHQALHGTGYGFALFLFDRPVKGHLSYISDSSREDMIKAVKEWLKKVEAS